MELIKMDLAGNSDYEGTFTHSGAFTAAADSKWDAVVVLGSTDVSFDPNDINENSLEIAAADGNRYAKDENGAYVIAPTTTDYSGPWRVQYKWHNAPEGQQIPQGDESVEDGTKFTVDDKYTSDTAIEVKDEKGKVTGTWTFSGWTIDGAAVETKSITVDKDIMLSGTWTYTPAEEEKPVPDTPADQQKPATGDKGPATGDDFNMMPLMAVMAIAAAAAAGTTMFRRRKNNQ